MEISTHKEIFIRLATKGEIKSEVTKKKALLSFSHLRGFESVYKSFGVKGRGFYYIQNPNTCGLCYESLLTNKEKQEGICAFCKEYQQNCNKSEILL